MWLRPLALLALTLGGSILATVVFRDEVLIALGLILVQIKLLAAKIAGTPLAAYLVWLKTQAAAFLRVEFIKAWLSTTVVPLMLGKALIRRLKGFLTRYTETVKAQQLRLMTWYRGLSRGQQIMAALVVIFATVAISVTSVGLWLVVFSVQVPFWLGAALAALGKMTWASVQKSAFKALAWLQLGWLWLGIKRLLPDRWLMRKRRMEFRMVRAVVRRRRLTVQQLADRKDRLPFRLGVLVTALWMPRNGKDT